MSPLEEIDLVITASHILPIIPAEKVYADCSVAINDGKILGVFPTADIDKRFVAREHRQLDNHVLMPGLINAHGHTAMSLLRGYADDLPLMTWLEEHIWPAEGQYVDQNFVHDGSLLAIAEMILSGTTCFSDMYFFPDATARVASQVGMRAQINFPVLDFPSAWAKDADDYIHKGLTLYDDFRLDPLITIGFGPHAPYTVSDEPLQRIGTLSAELQAPIHIHLHETAFEIEQSLKDHGKRPLQRLDDLGLLCPRTQCVHMTQVNASDITTLQESGASVIHCPESNLKLASGFCPVHSLLDAGINVAIGTDGAASNNDLDVFSELKTAALVGKHASQNASAIDAHTALHIATMGGARAMEKGDELGSIEAGKYADVIAIDLNEITAQPCYDIASLLVYTHRSHAVKHVWINGKHILEDRQFKTLNLAELTYKVKAWQDKLRT